MSRIVVFDLDGTLAKTEVYWLPVLEKFLERIEGRYPFSRSINKIEEALQFLGRPDDALFKGIFPESSGFERQEMIRIAGEVWEELEPTTPYVLYKGALLVVEELSERGYEIFLSSNCGTRYMQKLLDTGLRPWVRDVACAGMFPGLPKWQFTAQMLENVRFEEGYFVGDSASDMEAGRRNGLTTVYAAYGYAPRPPANLVDHVISGVGQLLSLLA